MNPETKLNGPDYKPLSSETNANKIPLSLSVMGSATETNGNHRPLAEPPSSSKPPSKRTAGGCVNSVQRLLTPPLLPPQTMAGNPRTPNCCPESNGQDSMSLLASPPLLIDGFSEDRALQRSDFLSREEVLRRRLRRLRQLSGFYKDQYWGLMEEVRSWYREYYWKYGKSPVEGEGRVGDGEEIGVMGGGMDLGFEEGFLDCGRRRKKEISEVEFHGCTFPGCKAKAMALTTYCHQHILSDTRQTLYKECTYVVKSAHTGQIVCAKPVLKSAVPSLCPVHFQKAQRHVSQALKKAGLNTSSSRLAPKFHVIVAEYMHQIQAKRRDARKAAKMNAAEDKHSD